MTVPPLTEALRGALRAASHPGAEAPLQALPDLGLAHAHVALSGTGLLARIPKQSQLRLPPAQALAYEAACFERASASGATPRLHGTLAPSALLPRGALLVTHVPGTVAQLPRDLPALARSLAAIHSLPLPAGRPPLLHPPDPLRALLDEIAGQAADVPAGAVPAAAANALAGGLERLRSAVAAAARPAARLIAFDAHPGNFLVDTAGRAWLVDLEKCRYGPPGLDLAHASLYTSTSWDVASRSVLDVPQVLDFYAAWEAAVEPELARAARPWHGLLRHAMWLWSLSWCARWRVLSARAASADPAAGEDWSADRSEPALVAHVRERVDHYLGEHAVERVRRELQALEQAWTE